MFRNVHPAHRIPVPETLQQLLSYLREQLDSGHIFEDDVQSHLYPLFCCDLDGGLLPLIQPGLRGTSALNELKYAGHPFEFFPIGWNGGDALQYGYVVHTTELERLDFPMASFAPGDAAMLWLGNDSRQGLEKLMTAALKFQQPARHPAFYPLCKRLRLSPNINDPDVGHGARIERRVTIAPPRDWRFLPTPNGVGVVAPERFFVSDVALPPRRWDGEMHVGLARRCISRGAPATALWVLHHAFRAPEAIDRAIVEVMIESYAALGREFLVARAIEYLQRH